MKKLCVLEQSGTVNDPYVKEKKRLFQTDNCDFFRLNWRYQNDPDAAITALNVLWSEGRSILFESVKNCYDYYMFIDDDIVFQHDSDDPLDEKIIALLEEFQPISANFYCDKMWGKNPITEEMRKKRRAYPFLCLDLQVTIYSREFAEIIFPIPFHGSDKCMWYAYWLAHKINPAKQICFSEITIKNTRSEPHFHEQVRANQNALVSLFNRLTKDKSFTWDQQMCRRENSRLFHNDPECSYCQVSADRVSEFCRIDSIYMKSRSPRRNLFHKLIVQPQLLLLRHNEAEPQLPKNCSK